MNITNFDYIRLWFFITDYWKKCLENDPIIWVEHYPYVPHVYDTKYKNFTINHNSCIAFFPPCLSHVDPRPHWWVTKTWFKTYWLWFSCLISLILKSRACLSLRSECIGDQRAAGAAGYLVSQNDGSIIINVRLRRDYMSNVSLGCVMVWHSKGVV